MANVNILIVVDTQATINGNTTVYLVDDDPNDQGQGGFNLVTEVSPGDTLFWRAVSINQVDTVQLKAFEDKSDNNLFNTGDPHAATSNPNGLWKGTVKDDATGTESYVFSFTINCGSTVYDHDPQIRIKPG